MLLLFMFSCQFFIFFGSFQIFFYGLTLIIDLSFFRMTLLLGPPGSGKTTLLQGLAGKLADDLRVCHSPPLPFV
jgi:tRNA A37 threonylcarbamoyladenosine biosynthesis protein TsaE